MVFGEQLLKPWFRSSCFVQLFRILRRGHILIPLPGQLLSLIQNLGLQFLRSCQVRRNLHAFGGQIVNPILVGCITGRSAAFKRDQFAIGQTGGTVLEASHPSPALPASRPKEGRAPALILGFSFPI